ncbi:hypothetical protein ABZX40_24425 [Streptomyces sp. NPDC004610]|uniref:hypothetical protein n=1 Tax=unclassified Streptomyces TaxID=2593676 RepID=UPI0033B2FE0C
MAGPLTAVPACYDDIAAFAEHADFPVVAKNREARSIPPKQHAKHPRSNTRSNPL